MVTRSKSYAMLELESLLLVFHYGVARLYLWCPFLLCPKVLCPDLLFNFKDGAIANTPADALITKLSMAFYPLDMQPF